MKNVCQLDPSGVFLGLTLAQESPKDPGVFLLPVGAIDVEPPQTPEGKLARWIGSQWIFEAAPSGEDEPEPPEDSPTEDPIILAERHVAAFFSVVRLLKMKVWYDQFPREVTPKLNAIFLWQDQVAGIALSGQREFPNPPSTFGDVTQEILSLQ